MARNLTMLNDLINPEVMADMVNAKIEKKIVVAPFAKIDTTLEGRAGNTVTVPQYSYIGDAEDVAEGVACGTVKLEAGTTTATVKKAMKAVELTDEAILSGYGDPMGETSSQLAKAIASKTDADCMEAITRVYAEDEEGVGNGGVQLLFADTSNKIKYTNIVDAIDLFAEEVQSEKVMFVNPTQVTTLRKDADFISADKYNNNVVMRGEIGMIAGTRIVPSKRVIKNTEAITVGETTVAIGTCWMNPIVKLNNDAEAEDDAPAITIYMKKETSVESERDTLARKTILSADKHYCAVLSNTSKVVLALIKA